MTTTPPRAPHRLTHPASATIPVGDVELHDDYLPGLKAGTWEIRAEHELRTTAGQVINEDELAAGRRIVVRAPQVAIDPAAVVARQPPDNSRGRYADVLPHVVLGDPMLPWERTLKGSTARDPWLALLVLTDDQLIGGDTSPTRTVSTTVEAFLAEDKQILKPELTPEPDVADSTPCTVVQVQIDHFHDVVPRPAELRHLAHCRAANTGDRPDLGAPEDGLFSVVVANRFPVATTAAGGTGTKNVVHLVSLEGHQRILTDKPDFRGRVGVALLSLCSWSFWAYPDPQADFRVLATKLTKGPDGTTPATRDQMWLRPPPPRDPAPTSDAGRHAERRRTAGYVPLTYRTRSAEDTFAWYRGPLTPLVPAVTAQAKTARSSDALIAYEPEYGVFDLSLATAFETGRCLALADVSFAQRLLALRRHARQLIDTLYHRATSTHLPETSGARPATTRAAFSALLDRRRLVAAVGRTPAKPTQGWTPPRPPAGPDDQRAALRAFLGDDATVEALREGLGAALPPVAQWLGKLALLESVPFGHLVPVAGMLPRESLRFFHLDPSWAHALLSGALAIGTQSGRDAQQAAIIDEVIRGAALGEAATLRARRRGEPVAEPAGRTGLDGITGVLLRSALVSGWPNLAVRGYAAGTTSPVPVLRMDRLSPTVLFCLFDRAPRRVEIAEPQEGFRFGVDDDGKVPLREPRNPATLGRPYKNSFFRVRQASFLRRPDAPGPVLNLMNLVAGLAEALHIDVRDMGPADLALQLVKSPEAVRFDGPSA